VSDESQNEVELTTGASALARAVRTLLRPLVRLLLSKQLTYTFIANLLKSVFVEVAEAEFSIEGRRQTDSRLSLLTSIHRKEVKRLRAQLGRGEAMPSTASLGALVVSRWIADPDYLDESGNPKAIPRTGDEEPSFASLVESVSKDIPACSVLDEWIRLGVVESDERDRVVLRANSFVPNRGLDEKLHFFGRNLHDHISAGVHNILEEGEPTFDRLVFYDRLTVESAEELSAMAREEGAELLNRINRRALSLQTRDSRAVDATNRISIGTYFHSAPMSGSTPVIDPGEEESHE
jgi:hypothetical protein